MKILHCCLACFYIDNYSYQENILPRYHKRMGHEVMIVASTESFDENGELTYVEPRSYKNEDDIPVVRLSYVKYMPFKVARKMRKYIGLKKVLESFCPDFIFIHDIQFLDISIIKEYAKMNSVRLVADCHADFSNSARSFLSRTILHGVIYKHCAKIIEPYVERFYGVLPARVEFLRKVYDLPYEKTSLLVMGAEDEKASNALEENHVLCNRDKNGICRDDFVIVFGGKIDNAKRQVLLLMDAVNQLQESKIKLLVFGSVIPEMKKAVLERCGDKVKYLGWATTDQSYEYFGMGDVVCFPGRHSVYWEQVAGMGIPMIVKKWDGTTHINVSDNVIFLEHDSTEEIANALLRMMSNYNYYKCNALRAKNNFMYSKIAEICLNNV